MESWLGEYHPLITLVHCAHADGRSNDHNTFESSPHRFDLFHWISALSINGRSRYTYNHPNVGDVAFELIDTPGFDDSVKDDIVVLQLIATITSNIAGVIFMHSVHEDRISGEARTNLRVVKAMCGQGFYKNVVICSTKWNNILPNKIPDARARMRKHLQEPSIFGDLMAQGASHMEFWADQSEPCLGVLQHFASLDGGPQMAIERQLANLTTDIHNTHAFMEVQEIRALHPAQGSWGQGRVAYDANFGGDAQQKHRGSGKSSKGSKQRSESVSKGKWWLPNLSSLPR